MIKVLVCGDFIVYGNQINLNNPFGDFQTIIRKSDIAIYNQEFPLTSSSDIYATKKYSLLAKTDPKCSHLLSSAGFNYASLANNHIFNYGVSGLQDTIKNLNDVGIKTFGAGTNLSDASKICYVNKGHIRLAFLNFAESEFNCASNKHGGANPYDVIDIIRSITIAKKEADFVFLILHGGIDYCKLPSPRMIKTYRFFAEMGVSAIIGHHTHVVSSYEIHNNVPIFYGIGNFIPGKIVTKDVLYSFPVQFSLQEDGQITFKGFPLKFNKSIEQLEFLVGDEEIKFRVDQEKISKKIKNIDGSKSALMTNYLTEERESYYFTLFTRSNYFLFKLFRKLKLIRLYHRYMSKKMRLSKKNSTSWNILRCETHRDVLDLIYEKHIDTYRNE